MCRANVTFKKFLGDDFAVRFSLRKACKRFGSRRINFSTVERVACDLSVHPLRVITTTSEYMF